ncbi:hypothetical protein ASPZODRAFT_143854 [Penicilliopsis zonata CBS 506.65]|uniref:Uncharacterized protein n=1 Tax=Penicilliopsis zonata CBS 506.65 TaxID=1073090 RepID=A0A1L9SDD0_9EURO|nr:hypothetical protein ASPZODRAFT_143854 [Penicilliopsis zonata CBS 506.65]OJJ45206.1 hypothetical protein ASPZODRAFT_143854 [Penicilliopsis zonata CBS 506.65]
MQDLHDRNPHLVGEWRVYDCRRDQPLLHCDGYCAPRARSQACSTPARTTRAERLPPLRGHDGADYITGFKIAVSGALQKVHYKLVFVPAPRGPQRWELFSVKQDPGEIQDLGKEEPERFASMMEPWEAYKREVGVVGVAGEFSPVILGHKVRIRDEFGDPYD